MREIKFRGKAIDTDEWVYGVPVPNGFGTRVFIITLTLGDDVAYPMGKLHEFCREVIPETVSQYTGTNDKNGVEIYDGDIVKMSGKVWIVEWCKKYCQFRLSNATESTGLNFYRSNDYEVIGNKFDNPELLEG